MAQSINQAKEQAAYAAAKELVRLRLDLGNPIDVFRVIEEAGVWLLFEPLRDVQGVYLSDPRTSRKAILINTRRPLSFQRLTAAHEYGHFVMGHTASLDEAADVEPSDTKVAQEAAAQTFANDFLMPPQLVSTVWNSLGLPTQPRLIQPHQAYLLSLYLGVSYKALIYQLVALKRINWPTANRLAKYQPRQIKQLLGRNSGPLDSYADVWPISEEDKGRALPARVNDEINVALPETPSSGYRWAVVSPDFIDLSRVVGAESDRDVARMLLANRRSNETPVVLISDEFEGASSEKIGQVGTGGRRYLSFRVSQAGTIHLQLNLIRPWQPQYVEDTFAVTLHASPKATGRDENGPRSQIKQNLHTDALVSGTE